MHFRFLLAIVVSVISVWAAGDGVLNVRTDPQGVEVWVDDKYIGDSPIVEKKLKPGRYKLRLVDPLQHASTTEEIFIQEGQTTLVEKKISAKFGRLRVDTEPEGAVVSISTPLGKTPLSNDLMKPGKYRLEIAHPNSQYEPLVEEVVIPRGEGVSVSKTLQRNDPLDRKALLRVGLGAGAILGFAWAVVENGNQKRLMERAEQQEGLTFEQKEQIRSTASGYGVNRTLGIILGSACVVAFEIVAFF